MPFTDTAAGGQWVGHFVDWYNQVDRLSAIRFVTPNERHLGLEAAILRCARNRQYKVGSGACFVEPLNVELRWR
jgi:hypothetical protein